MDAFVRVGFALLARAAAPLVAIGLVLAGYAIWSSPPARSAGPAASRRQRVRPTSRRFRTTSGPTPNWANSPQVLANAVVTLTDRRRGAGAEATATVDPKTGAISAVDRHQPGQRLRTPPDGRDHRRRASLRRTAAAATAAISPGVITSIAVNETGFGFTAPDRHPHRRQPDAGFEATARRAAGRRQRHADRRRQRATRSSRS